MATTKNRQLTITREGSNLRITVSYQAEFNTFERRLVGLGLRFRESIAVIGVDPPGATTGTVLPVSSRFPSPFFAVTDGAGTQTLNGGGSILVTRGELDEDSNPLVSPDLDADEIRCRIRIKAVGLPAAITPDAFTDQEVLGDLVHSTATAAKA
jgi:hypothetical protein